MNTVRLNITVPADVGETLKRVKNKSAYIAACVREKRQREEREKLAAQLAAAYKASAHENKSLVHDWDTSIGDGL